MINKIDINKIFYNFLLFLIFCGMIFTDLPLLPQYTVTHSLMIFIAPFVFFILIILNKLKINLKFNNLKLFLIYSFITLLISLFLLLIVFFIRKGNLLIYDKNMFSKTFEAFFSVTFLHLLVYYCLIKILPKIGINSLKKWIIYIFIFLTIVAFIELNYKELIDLFHEKPKTDLRIRLFNMEASHATLLYTVISFLAILFSKRKLNKVFYLIIFFIVQFYISSKGIWISMIISLVFISLIYIKKFNYILLLSLLLIISTYFFINIYYIKLLNDIKYFTSFATRTSGFLSLFYIIFLFPIGLGYGTYLFFYPDIFLNCFNFINNFFKDKFSISLSFNEINEIVTTGKNIGAKSGISNAVMFNGLFGLLFFLIIFYFLFRYLKRIKTNNFNKFLLRFLIILIFIQLFIGSEYTLLYIIWLPIAFLEVLYYNEKEGFYL